MAPANGYLRYNTDNLRFERSTDGGANFSELNLSGQTTISGLVPPGTVAQFAGSGYPSGWLPCDGAAVSRTTYAALFSAIGTIWGAGDGSTTFNVPDSRGRAPIGSGQGSGLSNRTLAGTVGVETHALSIAELAAHVHNVDPPSTQTGDEGSHTHTVNAHSHGVSVSSSVGSGTVRPNLALNNSIGGTANTETASPGTSNPGPHNHSVNIAPFDSASTGSGNAHQNMQPSVVFNFIIKT